MSSDPGTDPICSAPLDSITNADMDGIAVAVANVIVNLCLRITVTWSPRDVGVGVQSLLIQFYPILLSTLLSINRNQLSTLDAQFALLLSSSPLTVYLVVTSIFDLLGIHTGLYKRIESHRPVIRVLGALVLPLWATLSITYGVSARAFKDSSCDIWTFAVWLKNTIWSLLIYYPMLYGTPGLVFEVSLYTLVSLWAVFVLRTMHQVLSKADIRSNPDRPRGVWTYSRKTWCTINRDHKWLIYCLYAYFDCGWAYNVIDSAVTASGDRYVLSYGQLLSVFFAVPTFISTTKFVYSHRLNLLHLLRRLPRLCLAEARYLLTGKELRPTIQDSHLPFNITSYPEGPILAKPRDQIVTSVRSTHPKHRSPLLLELDHAMWNAWRQDTRFCASCATSVSAIRDKV